ncbi:MAG TPA: hypothetical protein VKZ59_09545 [Acidobacteriota bacterium]|nr:hypothetical protein [Acidobacteriota bacterium]
MKRSKTVCILFDEPAEQELLIDFLEHSRHRYIVASGEDKVLAAMESPSCPVILLEGNPRDHLNWLGNARGSDHQMMVLLIGLQEGKAWTDSPLIDHVVQPFDFVYLSTLLDLSRGEPVTQERNT